ncbi:MAG TPA: GspH/FimT family pseudopilin [Pseudolabrys sp.]
MAIIALTASLSITAINGTGRVQLKAVAMRTATLLRHERLSAILTGQVRDVSLDRRSRSFVGDSGETVAIPRDVVLDLLGTDEVWSGRRAVVRFYPDGASTGAALTLSREKAGYDIRVNWYTGSVAILASQSQ